jgi:hypothetical protein
MEDEDIVNRAESITTYGLDQSGSQLSISRINDDQYCTDSPDIYKAKLLKKEYYTNTHIKRCKVNLQPCGDENDIEFNDSRDSDFDSSKSKYY